MLKKDIIEFFTVLHTEIDMYKFKNKKTENNLYKTKTSIDPINSNIIEKDISNPSPIFKEILYINNKKIIKNKGKKQTLKQIKHLITQEQDNEFKKIKKKFPENSFLTECILNESSYKKALLYDKRTFFQFFCYFLLLFRLKIIIQNQLKFVFSYFHLLYFLLTMQYLCMKMQFIIYMKIKEHLIIFIKYLK